MTYGAQIQMRRPSVAGYSLPPLSAYEAWWQTLGTGGNGGTRAQPARAYRRLAAMIRSGASRAEKCAALGVTQSIVCRMANTLPEALK